ncbi:hypothetical protein FHS94_003336 [Sphingomonas aerophila]|uniref:Uncharacterized protein n=1 Tax=Sphingomonas aerophila TaxID=1344948 RepID=A0A7W9BFV2_9SPHN|nr:hypothetical protein [Sphingomonas aerophila]MBB5716470.1 hypothetical protein [Sphingomonas aerophila]
MIRLGIVAIALAAPGAFGTVYGAKPMRSVPVRQVSGPWDSGHVQGIAVDQRGGFIYYSFTNLLVKVDFDGRLVGTLLGWSGHLGDLDFNPADGKVYGSLEYKRTDGFYVAVIDVARLNSVGMDARRADLFRTVYLPEVAKDYSADLDQDGKVEYDPSSPDHRYGCSGIDGVAFGPEFGRVGGKQYLTVAYGIYGNDQRTDNDNQVLLQYDVSDWGRYARPLLEAAPHRSGPANPHGKYFVRTGNTRFGVQNLSYDTTLRRWFLGVYQGHKPNWPNYLLFAVDAQATPKMGVLTGVADPSGSGLERGLFLPLAGGGMRDPKTGVKGWMQRANVGFQPLGDGRYYIASNTGAKGFQSASLQLMRWTGETTKPLAPAFERQSDSPTG